MEDFDEKYAEMVKQRIIQKDRFAQTVAEETFKLINGLEEQQANLFHETYREMVDDPMTQ